MIDDAKVYARMAMMNLPYSIAYSEEEAIQQQKEREISNKMANSREDAKIQGQRTARAIKMVMHAVANGQSPDVAAVNYLAQLFSSFEGFRDMQSYQNEYVGMFLSEFNALSPFFQVNPPRTAEQREG